MWTAIGVGVLLSILAVVFWEDLKNWATTIIDELLESGKEIKSAVVSFIRRTIAGTLATIRRVVVYVKHGRKQFTRVYEEEVGDFEVRSTVEEQFNSGLKEVPVMKYSVGGR